MIHANQALMDLIAALNSSVSAESISKELVGRYRDIASDLKQNLQEANETVKDVLSSMTSASFATEDPNHVNDLMANLLRVARNQTSAIYMRFDQEVIEARKKYIEFKDHVVGIDFTDDVLIINKMWPYELFEDDFYAFKLPPITLSDPNAGEHVFDTLFIKIYHGEPSLSNFFQVLSEDNEEGYCHPHVDREGMVCWGEGRRAAEKFFENKQLLPLMHLLHSILSTYNSESPYIKLNAWTGIREIFCSCCDEELSDDEIRYIADSSETGCSDCTTYCEGIDEYLWNSEVTYNAIDDHYLPEAQSVRIKFRSGNRTEETSIEDHSTSFEECEECEDNWYAENLKKISDSWICPECMENRTFCCEKCLETKLEKEMNEFEDQSFCDECYEKETEECS